MFINNFSEFFSIEKPSNKRNFKITFNCPNCGILAKSNYLLLERFGEKRFFCAKCLRERSVYEKYGVTNVAKSKEIINKGLNTKKEKYGENWGKDWYIKSSKTINDKYNVPNVGLLNDHYEKCKKTMISNYGSLENAKDEVRNNTKLTLISKYGSLENFNKIHMENTKKAIKEKYGVDNISQTDIWKNKHLVRVMNRLIKTNNDIRYFYKKNDKYYLHCVKCNNDFLEETNSIIYRCPICFPITIENSGSSYEELEVLNFIKSIYNGSIEHRKKGLLTNSKQEIDIFLPDLKIGIEFDGIYWHKSDNPNNFRDYNKLIDANNKGIRLIRIWENEWNEKQNIVKSIIRSILKIKSNNIIMARKCIVKEISNKECKLFCDINHLQGGINSSINLGLFYNNELIQIMSFNKSRFSKKYEWEMMRECSKLDTSIIGGKGKLLKFFEKVYKPKSLVSYCNRRYFNGNSYKLLNFKEQKPSKPAFWVISKDRTLKNRLQYTKPNMKKMKDFIYNENLSQVENCLNNNCSFMIDCGQLIFTKIYK